MELRKLNIEQRLWEASRKQADQDPFASVARTLAGKSVARTLAGKSKE